MHETFSGRFHRKKRPPSVLLVFVSGTLSIPSILFGMKKSTINNCSDKIGDGF